MSKVHTESMQRLMERLAKLPGIGPRTAERLAYHILQQPPAEANALAEAINAVKAQIQSDLQKARYNELRAELHKRLRKNAKVEVL